MTEKKAPEQREDPLIDEVRAIRRSISDRFDGDLEKLCKYLREIESRHAGRVVSRSRKDEKQDD